jgi:5-methylcytosine-specific restriction endonuclease McrA
MVGSWLKHSTVNKEGLTEWDNDIHHRRMDEMCSKMQRQREKTQKSWFRIYNQYLKSQEWTNKREDVLKRDQEKCQGCLYSKANHVHHLSYENVGDEPCFELISLCEQCHERVHGNRSLDNSPQTSSHGLSSQDAS